MLAAAAGAAFGVALGAEKFRAGLRVGEFAAALPAPAAYGQAGRLFCEGVLAMATHGPSVILNFGGGVER